MEKTSTTREINNLYITQPQSDIDIEHSLYLEDLQIQLSKSDLYVEYHKIIKKLRYEFQKNYILFENTPEQNFAKEVFYRIMEESWAYLADLQQGAFFAANHHTRALLELSATVEYVLSEAGKENKFIERFDLFPHVAFHKVLHNHDKAFLKLSEDIRKELFSDHNELNPKVFDVFGTKSKEKLLEYATWHGNGRIANLFTMCDHPEVIKSDYAKLCLFTHISSICRRSEFDIFPKFCKDTERMLLLTVRYAVFSFASIKQGNLLDFVAQDKFDSIFLPLADTLAKSHEALGYVASSK